MQRKHIQVFGTVQGVGFRFYTQRIAHQFNIEGTVQNVEDYVDIYAQGDDTELEQFIDSVIHSSIFSVLRPVIIATTNNEIFYLCIAIIYFTFCFYPDEG